MQNDHNPKPSEHAQLADWLDYLGQIHISAIDLGLDRLKHVAAVLQLEPEQPATVFTVAGTNGKGSTTKAISELCIAAGEQVGLYQSPHIYEFNERIQVNGKPASDELILTAIKVVDAARLSIGESLSFFETTTLAAFWVFRELKCSVWVLEVGLGGRLDATNLIAADVGVVTSIALDHADWLGSDLEQIGREKAGVLRAGKVAVVGQAVTESVLIQAKKLNCQIKQSTKDFVGYEVGLDFWVYSSPALTLKLPMPKLAVQNVSLAVSAVLASPVILSTEQCRLAMSQISMAGRFEVSSFNGRSLVQDALHNPAGAEFFVRLYKERFDAQAPVCVVFSMLTDKDIVGVLVVLASALPQISWYTASMHDQHIQTRAASIEQLQGAFERVSERVGRPLKVSYYGHLAQAYTQAQLDTPLGGTLLVCGSFHTLLEAKLTHES